MIFAKDASHSKCLSSGEVDVVRRHSSNISGNLERSYNGEKKIVEKLLEVLAINFPHSQNEQTASGIFIF